MLYKDLSLLTLDDISSPLGQERLAWPTAPVYLALGWWLRTFVAQPNPEVGRPGDVCPFVRPAIERRTLWIAGHEALVNRPEALVPVLEPYISGLQELPPHSAKDRIYKTILVVFPGLHNEAGFRHLDDAHRLLKPVVVPQGLMVGQFHPLSNEPGVIRREFRPTRSPVPFMAIRFMVAFDLPFLTSPEFFNEYDKRFGNCVPQRLRARYQQLKAGTVAG
jgi:hypothetical protein